METTFERIKHINKNGFEYWSARELSKVLEYKDYRNFILAVDKAMEACKNSGFPISNHFGETTTMIEIGKGGKSKGVKLCHVKNKLYMQVDLLKLRLQSAKL